ncbi:MAG TPA: hypothetical protein VI488_05135 [Candidatus Angelobacter sp.]
MKKRTISSVLTLGLLIPTAFLSAKPAPAAQDRDDYRGRCPRIHEAARALEVAEKEMQEAKWDYCGDKVQAMRATRRAIEELRKAEQCKDCGGGDRDHDRK